jgi:hypothetical protein
MGLNLATLDVAPWFRVWGRRVSGPGPQRLGARFCRAARNLGRPGPTRTGELGGRVVAGGRTSQCQLPPWHPPGARGSREAPG